MGKHFLTGKVGSKDCVKSLIVTNDTCPVPALEESSTEKDFPSKICRRSCPARQDSGEPGMQNSSS